MGLNGVKGRSVKIIPIVAMVIIAAGATIVIMSQEPEHESGFTLDGVVFLPSAKLDISEGGEVIDDGLRDELDNSTFSMVIDIPRTPHHWVQNYTYEHEDGDDLLVVDGSQRPDMRVTDWDYGERYDFTVRFVCDSDNQTVQGLQCLDEDLFISGSFVVRDRQRDEVVLDLDAARQHEDTGRQWIVYLGEVDFSSIIDLDAWVIEVEEDGRAWTD